jgi:type II secretory pathway pseudopilin PulG
VAMNVSSERGLTMVELLVSTAVMVVVLGVSTTVLTQSSRVFVQQRGALDGRNSAAASIDLLSRLLRQSSCISATNVYCQSIFPDVENDGAFNSVRVQADWNPRDGALDDPYEDVYFVVGGGTLWKREPADAQLVSFGDNVQSLTFTYTNQNGGPLNNPVARPDLIGGVTITVVTTAGQGLPAVTSASTVSVRRVK